ncbi:hypothetical protein BDZ89DRAFT_1139226 [Hymenopellis radicata]|nr:hypothetical protein BDZ89DRAFT_1139226 [Hymenopellis radicata]
MIPLPDSEHRLALQAARKMDIVTRLMTQDYDPDDESPETIHYADEEMRKKLRLCLEETEHV